MSDLLHESFANQKTTEPVISKVQEEKEIQTSNSQELQAQFEEKVNKILVFQVFFFININLESPTFR